MNMNFSIGSNVPDYADGTKHNGPWDIIMNHGVNANYGGWFHVYAFTMTLGVVLSIAFAAWRLKMRKVPLAELLVGAIFIVPFSLLGASFFGKFGTDAWNNGTLSFWGLFAFWEAGMSIHGGVLFGAGIGLLIFYFLGRRTKVSLWVYSDAIMPNILVGQIVGRWGNFFNHEIPGSPVADLTNGENNPYTWMPKWLYQNVQGIWTHNTGETINGHEMINGHLYQLEPNFLFEGFGLFLAWSLIMLMPAIFRLISKKPWKIMSDVFTLDVNYSFRHYCSFKLYKDESKIGYYKIWDLAYYSNIDENELKNYEKYKEEHKSDKGLKAKWNMGKALDKANNPNGYLILRTGVEAGSYFFLWNLVRLVLEVRKQPDDLFIIGHMGVSVTVIAITMAIGLVVAILAQTVFPFLTRKEGFIFEKEYFIAQ